MRSDPIRPYSVLMRFLGVPLLLLLLVAPLVAQTGATTTYYPEKLYPGENVVTISNPSGIDRIQVRSTSQARVSAPDISGCPKEVNVRVTLQTAVGNESATFTVFDCNGGFSSHTISSESWTIRHEQTGNVWVGRDTCIQCEIRTVDPKVVDSITVTDPDLHVRMPSKTGGRWLAVGDQFKYQVCYQASQTETRTETIRLYIRREYPNGGLTQYTIEKPVTLHGVPPPEPPKPKPLSRRDSLAALLPPRIDPTTFRNIVMPTAEGVRKGRVFLASYDIAGILAGYGVTDELTVMGGGVFVPAAISRVVVGTVGAKYELAHAGDLRVAAGFQFGYSSVPESDITAYAPYGVVSYGDRENRISATFGYSWKRHVTPGETFDRNAALLAVGGDVTVGYGWKIVAETYMIESSGLAPLAATVRWFNDHLAIDAGLAVDLAAGANVKSTGTLSGEIDHLAVAPVISAMWVW